MMKHVLWCVALVMVSGCGPAGGGGGGSGGGSGGGNTTPPPDFHGTFTMDRHTATSSISVNTDLVEKFSLDLEARWNQGSGSWDVTGTALLDKVEFNYNGHCLYTFSGSQPTSGTMSSPVGATSADFGNGTVSFGVDALGTNQPTLMPAVTNLDHYYTTCPSHSWYNKVSSNAGRTNNCTASEDTAKYSSQGFAMKYSFSCPSTYENGGVTYNDTLTSTFDGSWVPN